MITKKLIPKTSIIKPPVSQKLKAGLFVLKKGEEVGEHVAVDREEVIIILQGKATVTIENEIQIVEKDYVIYIPPNKKHNIKNDFDEELKYIYAVTLLN